MNENIPTVTLSEAKSIIKALAHEQSVLLLSAPGVGKSDSVMQAAADAGLPCRSLLGTQIAPEDVSGIPRIVGERSVFCPPRILLPENPEPFCLFLDELPACTPDIQKSFYSLLLERRLGEHQLPTGTWVVAAGNRAEDRSLVRSMSAALINRVIILNVRVDVKEWLVWAHKAGVRKEILSYVMLCPEVLMRPIPSIPGPFSTPRAWVSLARALDLMEASGTFNPQTLEALAFGRVSPEDAARLTSFLKCRFELLDSPEEYIQKPQKFPKETDQRWFLLHSIRKWLERGMLDTLSPNDINIFLQSLRPEECAIVLLDELEKWEKLGAADAILNTLFKIAGIDK